MPSSDDLLTTGEAAAIPNVSSTTIRRWSKAGLLPEYRTPTGRRRFKRSDVERVLTRTEPPEVQAG